MSRADLPLVFRALIDSRSEWQSVQDLAAALGVEVEVAAKEIGRHVEEGFLEISWVSRGWPRVRFTPYAQATVGLELSDVAAVAVFKWVYTGKTSKPPRRRVPRERVAIEDLPDPSGDPLDQLIAAEEAEADAAKRMRRRERKGLPLRHEDVPPPTIVLLGPPLAVWNEVRAKRERRPSRLCSRCHHGKRNGLKIACECGRRPTRSEATCPVCRARKLPRNTVCARCRNWGWDDYFNPPQTRRVDDDRRTGTQGDSQPGDRTSA